MNAVFEEKSRRHTATGLRFKLRHCSIIEALDTVAYS